MSASGGRNVEATTEAHSSVGRAANCGWASFTSCWSPAPHPTELKGAHVNCRRPEEKNRSTVAREYEQQLAARWDKEHIEELG